MPYMPVAGYALQTMTQAGEVASGYYLKFYEANTTTPLSMATDSAGSTLLVKAKLNDNGMPISNPLDNTTVFIPFVNQAYRLVIYTSEADADANNTASAFVNIASTPLVQYESQLLSNRYFMTYGGTPNAITLTSLNKSPDTAYATGLEYRFKATATNTGSATINVDGLGNKTCKLPDGGDLTSGYISITTETTCYYDGANFIVLPPIKDKADTVNGFINGDFQIWQQGAGPFSSGYSADQLRIRSGVNSINRTSLNIPDTSQYGALIAKTSTGSAIVEQPIEAANSTQYVGKEVTVSFYSEEVSGQLDDIDVSIYYANSEDDFSASTLIETVNIASPNDGARNSAHFAALPANAANGIEVRFSFNVTSSTSMTLAEYKIEKGDTATGFVSRSKAEELADCQRYGFDAFGETTQTNSHFGLGYSASTTNVRINVACPVTLRAVPTAISTSGTIAAVGTTSQTISSASIVGAVSNNVNVGLDCAVTGATAGEFKIGRKGSDATAKMFISAQL